MTKVIRISLLVCLSLIVATPSAMAQPNADEIRAMAELCSSGASIRFRGEIAGGLTKYLGKIVAGEGEWTKSRGEDEFLSSFKDERLRLEARKIYNNCAIEAIRTLREERRRQSKLNPEQLNIVNGASSIVPIGRVFSLRPDQSAVLAGGGVLSLRRSSSWRNVPSAKLTNNGAGTGAHLKPGLVLEVPYARGCIVSYLSASGAEQYNFLYECS